MADKDNQQYKWRQRKKRNTLLTVWIVAVIFGAAGGTFVYDGMKESDPLKVAKKYVESTVGVTEYETVTGARSLNDDNQFIQEYTFNYTADGKPVTQSLNMIQQTDKKYGLFEQWGVSSQKTASEMELELIAPKDSQVLINGYAPEADEIVQDEDLSPGAACYTFKSIPADNATLQVSGLPFDYFEMKIDPTSSVLDVRDKLTVGTNAQTQMTEIGKQMINELFTAAVQDKGETGLGTLFDHAANKTNLYNAIRKNLYKDDVLQAESLSFSSFKAVFGDVYYPGKEEDSYIGIEMKLSYLCEYEPLKEEKETEETEGTEETAAEEETEQTEKETEAAVKSAEKEAVFYFKYSGGKCTVTSVEVPNAIS